MADIITSKSNPKVKLVQSLKHRKHRQKEQKFVIEGIRMVDQAVKALARFDYVLYTYKATQLAGGEAVLEDLRSRYIPVIEVMDDVFSVLCDTENPQGMIAVIHMSEEENGGIPSATGDLVLVLDRIQDPGNLGTMIRTADAAGIKTVICTKGTVDHYNDKALRSSMGSIFSVEVVYMEENELLDWTKSSGFALYATDLNTEHYYYDVSYTQPVALIIGNEGNGISESLLSASTYRVKIPIYGEAESLNASIAGGILMYHAALAKRRVTVL